LAAASRASPSGFGPARGGSVVAMMRIDQLVPAALSSRFQNGALAFR